LIDLMDRRAIELSGTRFLVLDEADQMLDIGFIHALRRIAPMLGKDRQTMMFSATMPKVDGGPVAALPRQAHPRRGVAAGQGRRQGDPQRPFRPEGPEAGSSDRASERAPK
jgi:hypothetical protein